MSPAHAVCTGPNGDHGDMLYNLDHTVMQYCNGTHWVSMDASRAGFSLANQGACPQNEDVEIKWKIVGGKLTGRCIKSCPLPSGAAVEDGSSVTLYNVATHSNCASRGQVRTCNGGALSGDAAYQYETCSNTCTLDGITKNNNETHTFYSASQHTNCASVAQSRKCVNGVFDGSSAYDKGACAPLLAKGFYAWTNSGSNGMVGNGQPSGQYPNPTLVSAASHPQFIVGEGSNFCFTGANNKSYCFGNNSAYGSLGLGASAATGNYTTPTLMAMPSGVSYYTDITLGQQGGCGRGNNGHTYCWGMNSSSMPKIGLGNTTDQKDPVQLPYPSGVTAFTSISSGSNHNCYAANNGHAYCAGSGTQGSLGNGAASTSASLVQVTRPAGVGSWSKITAGSGTSCAIANTGKVYCWGYGESGKLGNGTSSGNSLTPVEATMPSGVSGFTSVAQATSTICAIANTGNAYCWGYSAGTVPTLVTKPSGVNGWTKIAGGNSTLLLLGDNKQVYRLTYPLTLTAIPGMTRATDVAAATFVEGAIQGD